MPYGDWMNGLQGMTAALGAASPYAQQLAENNARQAQLAQMIRSGVFGGVGGYGQSSVNYPTQPGFSGGGGASPYPAPTPFPGFADILKPKLPTAPPQLGDIPEAGDGQYGDSTGTGDGSPGVEGASASYDNFKDWLGAMKGLGSLALQVTPFGIAKSVYGSGGFDPALRAIGLGNLTAAGRRIAELSSPGTNYGSVGATYATIPEDVSARPDWWNAGSLKLPGGELTQQQIRDWSNILNAAAAAEQSGELPGYTGTPIEPTAPNAPIPWVQVEPLLSPVDYIAGLLGPQSPEGMRWLETKGGGTWVPEDYREDSAPDPAPDSAPDSAPGEPQWDYDFDTGKWNRI